MDIRCANFFPSNTISLTLINCKYIDLIRFSQLYSLILHNPNQALAQKIQPEFFPHLKYLSIAFSCHTFTHWWNSLHHRIFSNKFLKLYKACLACLCLPSTKSVWRGSPSITKLEINEVNRTGFLHILLYACPNLRFLRFRPGPYRSDLTTVFKDGRGSTIDENIIPSSAAPHYQLQRLEVLSSDYMNYEFFASLLQCLPNLKQLRFEHRFFDVAFALFEFIATELTTSTPILESFYSTMTDTQPIAIDETIRRNIQDLHSLFNIVKLNDSGHLIVSSFL
ncbi:unnamed protein product [Rotaria sp. Silwood1]|nr:unnamed protein product [Rotaria sp. Silwood1]CAF1679905.1 unnamed protein product [Rotaria sp. Silwood1]